MRELFANFPTQNHGIEVATIVTTFDLRRKSEMDGDMLRS